VNIKKQDKKQTLLLNQRLPDSFISFQKKTCRFLTLGFGPLATRFLSSTSKTTHFIQNPLSSKLTSQMTIMGDQDDLAALFARNLSLQNQQYEKKQTPTYIEAPHDIDPPPYAAHHPIIYSISQHYTHSAHVVKTEPVRSASVPLATDQQTVEIILARHGVDAATLFPAQIQLFKTADPSQQMRLVELWRIAPPNYGGHALAPNLCDWHTTNFEQEEALAKMRYERKIQEEQKAQAMDQETDMGDKPYMTSGYEELARREYEASCQQQQNVKDVYSHLGSAVGGYTHATDPVYNIIPNSGPEWKQRQRQAMENQYGSFQQQGWSGIKMIPSSDDMDML